MTVPSQQEYEANEARMFHRDLAEIERTPLNERKEAAAEFAEALRERPERVAERVGWLLGGNYGFGSYKAARDVLKRPRANRAAWLVQTIASLEWRCPQRAAAKAWTGLTPTQKKALAEHVNREIRAAEQET